MTDKLSIPEIRQELWRLAAESRELAERQLAIADRVDRLAHETFRREAKKHARAKARRVTPALREQVRAYALANPGMLNRDIGRQFDIDGGRVSEILHGLR